MKNTVRQVASSPKFMIGFGILFLIIMMVILYPVISPGSPLRMIGNGTFFPPGTYVNMFDATGVGKKYTLNLEGASEARIAAKLPENDRQMMKRWLVAFGIPADAVDTEDTHDLLQLWWNNYDTAQRLSGFTLSDRRYCDRIDKSLHDVLNEEHVILATPDEAGALTETGAIETTDYVNVNKLPNVKFLPLGTDNFGRDVMKELAAATGTSLLIGLTAGLIATFIGLALGLLAGYVGGILDDIIMFVVNLFTVIPSFVILILISFSIGQQHRGAMVCAAVIGLTSWVWTTRSVRAQVISLRNRDHVNLSKLSGHSLIRIVTTDILPYIASYVVMALILQIVSGILAEANLSMLGLGPATTKTPTLGLMMYWAMTYTAHINGSWWAYFPVIITIALVSFSMNLMNTGLDQIFNPQLRDD